MTHRLQLLWTTVGKKVFAAVTGLLLILFVIAHLAGNLLLFHPDPAAYNAYSHKLISLGPLLCAAEFALLAFFLVHIVTGIWVTVTNRRARGDLRYEVVSDAGKPSKKSLSSRSMIVSGIVLAVFIVLHLITFKYGPEYETTVKGVVMRDFHRLTMEVFAKEYYVVWYVLAMSFLWLHLRHGFWSAFQSLGAMQPRFSNGIHAIGWLLAGLLALGYIVIPIFIYVKGHMIS